MRGDSPTKWGGPFFPYKKRISFHFIIMRAGRLGGRGGAGPRDNNNNRHRNNTNNNTNRQKKKKKTFARNVRGERNTNNAKGTKGSKKRNNNEKGGGFFGRRLQTMVSIVLAGSCAAFLAKFHVQKEKERKDQESRIRSKLTSKPLALTQHGACRMECRFISEKDVENALRFGRFSPKHSTVERGKYAFERGRVRAIFGDNTTNDGDNTTTLVTAIDIDTDHPCGPC